MTENGARRLALVFLIALGVYTLACIDSPISWSPDSSKVAFLNMAPVPGEEPEGEKRLSQVWVADVATEKCTKLYESKAGLGAPVWSPDGKHLAFCKVPEEPDQPVVLILLGLGGEAKRHSLPGTEDLGDRRADVGMYLSGYPASWRPDGKAVCVAVPVKGKDEGSVLALVVDTTSGKIIWQKANTINAPSWSPDGKWVAGHVEDAFVLLSTADWSVKELWRPKEGAEGAGGKGVYMPQPPAWSPDSTKLCLTNSNGAKGHETGVWVADVASGEAKLLTGNDNAGCACWSPDGKQIVCSLILAEDETELMSIVTIDLATGEREPLVVGRPNQPVNMTTAWSPDGKWIAYRSTLEGAKSESVVRLVSRDGKQDKALYVSDQQMLTIATSLTEQAQEAENNADLRKLLKGDAKRILKDIPKRFPDTKLTEKMQELEKALKDLEPR